MTAAAAAPMPSNGRDGRMGRTCLLLLLVTFALVMWFGVRHGIGTSWRECDTQAIARNFVRDGFDPLRPRVDWRGDTDGAVECEFPCYQLLVGAALAWFGDVEWPGRALSLLSLLFAMTALHRLLEARCGPAGALAGVLVFACSGSAALLATRVMPDALCLAFALASLVPFVRYLEQGRGSALLLAAAALALAGLQKPLALQIGMVQFGWAAVMAPRRLRESRLWFAWSAVLALVGAWLWHGRDLHTETGLTFGVVSGGDSKFPDVEHLLSPDTWWSLFCTSLRHGCSVFGVIAFGVLLLRRRLDRRDAVLLGAVAIGLLVSLRYSCTSGLGPHYHMFAAVAGAWLVARAWPASGHRWLWLALLLATAAHAAWRLRDERGMRNVVIEHPLVPAAAAVRAATEPADLVVVHGDKPQLDLEWHRPNNFEDPRVFYLAERRGWALSSDALDPALLADLRRRGARVLLDEVPQLLPAPVAQWLAANAELLFDRDGVRVYRLHRGE